MIGRTLAHYEILEPLGKGGMGEVYRALDTKLDRQVALKILPAELAGDPRFTARFEREAKTVAALNHPNIVTLHSVEEVDGVHFLTMELVEGQGLDRKVPKGGLELERFLELALPLTEAVAAAHEAGVTHRDLKPANVLVSDDGRLKVLDFGLAKVLETSEETLTLEAPTEALTREGLVVGTVPYMSPEQLQGEPVDARSDIFSLGIILYELLVGRRPFPGRSSAETISALLRDTPTPVDQVKAGTPRHLSRVIRRCLEKDPARRYRSARDLVLELQDLKRDLGSERDDEKAVPATPSRPARAALLAAVAVIAVVVVSALAWKWAGPSGGTDSPPESRTPLRLTKLTGAPGLEDEPAWSPDGRFLAYTTDELGNLDIVIQPIGGGQLIRALAGSADEASPTWSPDGQRLAFISSRDRGGRLSPGIGLGPLTVYLSGRGGDLFVAPAFGGPASKLAQDAYMPAWSPDGERIAYVTRAEDQLTVWTIAADGGRPEQLSFDGAAFDPAWSPDGARIAFGAIDSRTVVGVQVVDLRGGSHAKLDLPPGSQVMGPAWSNDGQFLYFTSNLGGRLNLWRVKAPDGASGTFGEPHQITFGGGSDVNVNIDPVLGRIAFSTVTPDVNLWELEIESGQARQITNETGIEINPRMSPDGRTLLVATDRGGAPEIWTYSVEGEPLQKVGPAVSVDFTGVWAPDGRRIAYSRGGPDGLEGVVVGELGSLSQNLLLADAFAGEWSPDGAELLASRLRAGNDRFTDVVSIHVSDGTVRQLTDLDTTNQFTTWSPDGREIIFNSEATGTRKLWRIPAGGGDPEQLTFGDSEDSHPRWSPTNPGEVMFLRNHSTICLLDPDTGEVRELTAELGPHGGLDYPSWSADGTRVFFSVASKTGDIYVTEE